MTRICILAAGLALAALPPRRSDAQIGISIGAGVGIAGGTDQSLSNGQSGWVLNGQVTKSVLPVVSFGAEVDHLQHTNASATFGTAIVELDLPVLPFFFTLGAGYGKAEVNDSNGSAGGAALQVGAGYKLGIPLIPIGVRVFGNAYFAYGSSRSAQMVDAGLAVHF